MTKLNANDTELYANKEDVANKDTDVTLAANSDVKYASQKAIKAYVQAYVASYIAAQDVMVFKGVVDCSANPNYPAADAGFTYRVSVAGKIGGVSGVNVEAGDILLCLADGSTSGNQATVGANWSVIQVNIDGAVTMTGAQTLINKVINAANNTITNLTLAMLAANVADTDVALAANSDTRLATQKATKAYADTKLAAADNLAALTSASTARGNLGLGSSATVATGTSGATVPLLNGVNTWSAAQKITGTLAAGSAALAGGQVQISAAPTVLPTTGQYGQLELVDSANTAFAFSLGYSATLDVGFMQAVQRASAFKNIIINGSGGNVGIGVTTSAAAAEKLTVNGNIAPSTDNARTCGTASLRFSTIYAGTGTINTSAASEKTLLGAPDALVFEAVLSVPLQIYQWNDAIVAKGSAARLHYGPTADDVEAAFTQRGLDPRRYALFCEDEVFEQVAAVKTVSQQKTEQIVETLDEVRFYDDRAVVISSQRTVSRPVMQSVPLFDGAGLPIVVDGAPATAQRPVMEDVEVQTTEYRSTGQMRRGLRLDQFDRLRAEAVRRLHLS
ncbi:tail fiber domain-containing protein [Tardiphaga sp.]|uniref:tail fiber domain-containing protein n=1 Tax=Tardiphaga sp. TaxID=1926292 RepID=UPI00260BCB18|nr:tail fiber domain-containing protein [Tardiphaga sp.]